MIIENLFPTPIGFFDYTGQYDRSFLVNQEQRKNTGNKTSTNYYILNAKNVSELRHFIEKCLHEYFMATYNPKNDTRLKITQSWLNWTELNEYHHRHAHPNSLISGCFYLDADENKDKIYFYRGGHNAITFPPVEWNQYNSDSWWYSVRPNKLILFPSSLTHMVQPVESKKTRISLAFNTFPVGNIGDENDLTGLTLR